MKKILLCTIGFSLMVGCDNQQHDQTTETNTLQAGQHSAVLACKVLLELDYLIYLPENYGKEQKAWPLMVFLHGAGERGSDLKRVKFHGPPKRVEQGSAFPFILVSPQCPTDKWWPNMIEHVMALVDETVENYSIDENRIYLTGLSMGGYGTWAIASAYPERFSAIAPVCGGGLPYMAINLKNIPVWAFHGAKDPVVPLQQSQQMVDAVNFSGGNAKLTVYPEANHDSWTQTYNNDKLYEWLLSHSK
jgi:predicted peptidase